MKTFYKFIIAVALVAVVGLTAGAQELRSSSNSYLGKVESDGTVRNSSNSYIGKVESDGTVRNRSNSNIGKANGVPRQWAAAIFFFELFR